MMGVTHEVCPHRRGVVIVFVVVLIPVFIGMAALTLDVGLIVNAKADLQRAADAGAMAAAIAMSRAGDDADRFDKARAAALEIVEKNPVLGQIMTLDLIDVQFGNAAYSDANNEYDFAESTILPDAVRVTVRKSEGSSNGPLDLLLGGFFGFPHTNVEAEAVATIVPRDLSIVADVSGSQRYDSQLHRYDSRDIYNYELWDALPGGADDIIGSVWAPGELPVDLAQAAGPGWGFMKTLAYGDDVKDAGYAPSSDPGLMRLSRGTSWNQASLGAYLTGRGYNVDETAAITAPPAGEGTDAWSLRVATALGLARWDSGKAGGLGDVQGMPNLGDGDDRIESGELVWDEVLFGGTISESRGFWIDYIKDMEDAPGGNDFDERFGVKTVVDHFVNDPWRYDFIEDVQPEYQPLQAQKEALTTLVNFLEEIDSFDLMSLELYRGNAAHSVDLTDDHIDVSTALNAQHPLTPYLTSNTNIGDGIAAAVAELQSPRQRTPARKVILLLTDGLANRAPSGWDPSDWARHNAQIAADAGMQIMAVSVGQGADQDLMGEIATIANGRHFHAGGTVEEYTASLADAFIQIGLQRSVQLVK